MNKINVKSLAQGSGPLRVGKDLWVGVNTLPTRFECIKFARKVVSVAQQLEPSLAEFRMWQLRKRFALVWMVLTDHYEVSLWQNHSAEPVWMQELPLCFQRAVRADVIAFKEYRDGRRQFAICLNNRFHGYGGYVVLDEGIINDMWILGMDRLGGIAQLAFLHCPNFDKSKSTAHLRFEHTRLLHSYDVVVIMELLIANNHEVLGAHRNLLIAAAFLHDIFTPAGGDTTKGIDPEAFDEDAMFPKLFKTARWKEFNLKYKLDEVALAELILGKGPFGSVLDLADKSAYIGRDFQVYLRWSMQFGPTKYPELYTKMNGFAQAYPDVASLWQYAKYVDGKVVITDHQALYHFLLLRMMMFNNLYYSPRARFLEYVVGQILIKHLYETKKISAEDLLKGNDSWLEEVLVRETGFFLPLFQWDSTPMQVVETEEEVAAFRKLYPRESGMLVIVDRFNLIPKPATGRFFVEKDGVVLPFNEAYPELAAHVEAEGEMKVQIACYAVRLEDMRLKPEIVEVIERLA